MKVFFSILGCILTLVAFASFSVVAANDSQVGRTTQTKTVTVSESSNYMAKVNANAVDGTMTIATAPAETTVTIATAPETTGTTQTTAVTDNPVISGITAPSTTGYIVSGITAPSTNDWVISGITAPNGTVTTQSEKSFVISGITAPDGATTQSEKSFVISGITAPDETTTTQSEKSFVISGITAPDETTTTQSEKSSVISGITAPDETVTTETTATTVQTENNEIIPISGVVGDPCDLYHDKDGDGAITVYDLCLAKRNRDRDAYLIQDFLLVRNSVKATKMVKDVKNIQISEQSKKMLEGMYMNSDTVKFVEANGKRFLRFETGYYHDDTHGETDLFFEQLTTEEYSRMELQLSFYLNNVGNGSYHAYVYADADNGCYAVDVQYTNN